MYLTRVQIDLASALRAGLIDAYRWHQGLWTAFPGRDGQPRDFLTRVEEKGAFFVVMVLSQTAPEPPGWGRWETKPVASTFLEHRRYVFALRANPTVKRVVRDASGERRKNGRRTRICRTEELCAWLEKKGKDSGFCLDAGLSVGAPVDQTCWRGQRCIVHVRVDFQGVLTVTDPAAFVHAYRSGIGPAKAFGFGLMLLRPLRQERRHVI